MNNNVDVRKKEQLKRKMQVGDLLTASKMLDITTDAARMRLNRMQPEIVEALETIIHTREKLIQKHNAQ